MDDISAEIERLDKEWVAAIRRGDSKRVQALADRLTELFNKIVKCPTEAESPSTS